MSFLMGLNEIYGAIRGQILLMDPISPLSKVSSLLLQDEKQRKVGSGKKVVPETATALVALGSKSASNAKNFNKSRASGRPQCTHYGAMGHVVDKCYKLHGYSPGYKFKNKPQTFASNLVAIEDSSNEPVSLTRAEYQQFVSLLNSQFHFGTQAPPEASLATTY